MVKELDRK